MSCSVLFSLAIKNIRRHFRHNLQVFFGIFLSVTLVMTAVVFVFFIRSHIADEYPDNKICFIKYYNENMTSMADRCDDASKVEGVCCVMRAIDYTIFDFYNRQNKVTEDLSFENEILEIGDKKYKYSSSEAFKDEYRLNYGLEVSQIDNSVSDFSDYLYSYYDEPFLFGSDCINDNDIIIPEQYLMVYGVPESEYENCIGQPLTVRFSRTGNSSLIRKYNICGIVKKECYDGFPASMIIKKHGKHNSTWDMVYVYIKKYESKKFESEKNALDHQFGVKGDICLAYEKLNFLQKQSDFVGHILLLVISCVAAAVIFYMIVYMFFYIEQQQKYSAILLSLGMNAKKIALLNMTEVGISSFIATKCGIWCSYFVSLKADRLINEDTVLVTWDWNVLLYAHLTAIPVFVVLFAAIIGGYTYYKTSHLSPCSLFQE
ncbi:MAG: ABC transporter permease [Ruminococcus sp.]|nr:ABC transporter permease [Ruminococcus sp.]